MAGYHFDRERASSRLVMDVSRTLLGPRLCGIEGSLEGGVGTLGSSVHGVAGAYAGLCWAKAGAEYVGANERVAPVVSLRFPERRGGLFRSGDLLRLDYNFGRRELLAGFSFGSPFERYRANRPRETGVRLAPEPAQAAPPRPGLLGEATERRLDAIRHSMTWIDRMLTPHFEPGRFEEVARPIREHIRTPGHTFLEEDAAYHRALDLAFTDAVEGDTAGGRSLAAAAESVLFREVLVPFDRLFGREKQPASAAGFCTRAREAFSRLLRDRFPDAADGGPRAMEIRTRANEIFRRVLVNVEAVSVASGERWKNQFLGFSNRGSLAWLPLDYGIRPEQVDTQHEWDRVLASVTGEPCTDANQVEYLMMEQFHLALKRMIRETKDYQVTIVHDFRGRTDSGVADVYGWDLVVDGYLAAFIDAVRDLDAGRRRRLPEFYLFVDALYYEQTGSRGIVSFLEHLLDAPKPGLTPIEFADQVAARRDSLLAAIAASPTLRHADDRALRDAFRVRVNVTNQFDPAFLLDLSRRDHRKVAFADVTEEDPSAGVAVVTGQGIGEHYNGSGWEDRSLLVRGTSLVRLKTATHDLYRQHGFGEDEVPECLRPRAYPPDYAERCARLRDAGWTSRAAILINETSYGSKECTVLKAAMYDLAPPKSVLLSFDSLWDSDFWATMFIGAALRGVRALPVGPTAANAPSAAPATLYNLRATMRMLVEASSYFADEIERAGGLLRLGVYAQGVQTNDFKRRIEQFQMGARKNPFLRQILPWHASVDTCLEAIREKYAGISFVELQLRPRPFLHMKSQFFGTAEAFRILLSPELGTALGAHLAIRQRQVVGQETPPVGPAVFRRLLDDYRAGLDSLPAPTREHAIFTFTTGSHNQNPRSMLLDGEVLVAISGPDCVVALIDSMFMLFVSEWPENVDQFDGIFPRRHLPFYLKPLLPMLKNQG
ncbi:MAG: hypothetical protein ACM3JJ_09745 [Hyphomicrobiales bacterium]